MSRVGPKIHTKRKQFTLFHKNEETPTMKTAKETVSETPSNLTALLDAGFE